MDNQNQDAPEVSVPVEADEVQAEADDHKFFFSLQADDNGVTDLKFRKQSDKLFGTLLFAMDYVNQSFDNPFPSVGSFLRHLAEIADKVEEAHKQQEALNAVETDPAKAN